MAEKDCPELVAECIDIKEKFSTAFSLFSSCCKLYDQNHVGGKLDELGKSSLLVKENVMIAYYNYNTSLDAAITIFLVYYRKTFPGASITVKLHMLEDHMVPFLTAHNGVGFGLMGEQGAESIHADMNYIKSRYVKMPNRIDALRCTLKDHLLRCSPINIMAKPPIKRRKT